MARVSARVDARRAAVRPLPFSPTDALHFPISISCFTKDTLSMICFTKDPQPYYRNPRPHTRNPRPYTRNRKTQSANPRS